MYVIEMKIDKQYNQKEYCFETKKETEKFLANLNNAQIEKIISIEKYNKKSFRSAWYDFFESK